MTEQLPSLLITAPVWGRWFTVVDDELHPTLVSECESILGVRGSRWQVFEITVKRSDWKFQWFCIPSIAFATDEDAVEFRLYSQIENVVIQENRATT